MKLILRLLRLFVAEIQFDASTGTKRAEKRQISHFGLRLRVLVFLFASPTCVMMV